MTDQRTWLEDYVTRGSEQAFREVVTRYLNLVYSTAVRLVNGDTHLAEDVAQTVFADLARLAGTLSREVRLGGWLHRRTCHVAANLMRNERRRQNRERQAAEMNAQPEHSEADFAPIAPVLDEAINQLGAEDRAAILLRFFEGRDLRSVGQALGSSEDAAQKRVARALDKLRGMLGRRGVTASATVLAAVLSTQAVTAAPAGLAVSEAASALAAATTAGSVGITLLKFIVMSKLKLAVSAIVVAGIGTTLVLEHQALTKLREQNRALQQQVGQLTQQAAERPRRSEENPQASPSASLREEQLRELDRLRAGVDALRQQTSALATLRGVNRQLRQATEAPEQPEDPAETEFTKETQERNNHLKMWGLDFHVYASQNNDRLPDTWEQVMGVSQIRSSLKDPAELASYMSRLTNNFEIVYHGTTEGVGDPGQTILFREKQARLSPKGEWVKVYGFADGSTQIHTEAEETNFENWEKQHLVAPRSPEVH